MLRFSVLLLVLLAIPTFVCAGPATESTGERYLRQLNSGEEVKEFLNSIPREATLEKRVQVKAWSGDVLLYEGAVEVVTNSRGAARVFNAAREMSSAPGSYEGKIKAFVNAEDESWSERLSASPLLAAEYAAKQAMPFTTFKFAGLEINVLVPGADRVDLSVDERNLGPCNWTADSNIQEQLKRRDTGDYRHLASFSGKLNPAAEVWFPLPSGEPTVVNNP
jgi:hypothetical protein